MGVEGSAPPRVRKRTVAAAVSAALLLILFVAGLTFANSIGAARVAANAASLHWANSVAGTTALTRAALAQAITFSDLVSRGIATTADLDFAMEQVDASLLELETLIAAGTESPTIAYVTRFWEEAEQTASTLADSGAAAATDEIRSLEAVYLDLTASLTAEQDAIQEAINANTAAAARANGYVTFVLTLAIPASGVLVYWWVARRQMRDFKARTDLEIEAERSVSRAKDTFIAALSHELRTPLTSIYGFSEILSDNGATDPEHAAELAGIIANEAAEMSRMIDDLLAASRLESIGVEIEMAPTRVSSVVESAIVPFERAGQAVSWTATSDMVIADAARLRHILVNLISNAVRHGGPSVGIEVSSGEGNVDIEVWDNGPGVSEDRLASLFERFAHQGSAPLLTGSVGLGLAVASRLTNKLDGQLTYQRFGDRTYFVVSLPTYLPETGDEPEAESVSEVIRAMSS